MLLVYVDDTGNSWELENGFFKDGPYVIHVGILINQEKYFHLERIFYDLFSSILGIKDWRGIELHANEIWQGIVPYKQLSLNIRRKYFAEFVQMLAKLSVKIVGGIQQKNRHLSSPTSQLKQIKYSQYAFLHGLEHTLALQNETAVLISDEGDKILTLSRLLYERSQWRYNPGADKRKVRHLSKFKYETLSCFLLDQMHFVSSKESFFIQIVDHVSYLLQRVFTYSYLKVFPKEKVKANKDMVPIIDSDFKFFAKDIMLAEYKVDHKDVIFSNLSDMKYSTFGEYEYIPDHWIQGISPYK